MQRKVINVLTVDRNIFTGIHNTQHSYDKYFDFNVCNGIRRNIRVNQSSINLSLIRQLKNKKKEKVKFFFLVRQIHQYLLKFPLRK